MDLSPYIAWSTVAIGSIASLIFGSLLKSRREPGKIFFLVFMLLVIPVVLGIGLVLFAVLLHSLCIEVEMCIYRGDGNMGYWFHSFFAIPLFFIVTLATFLSVTFLSRK
jgi:hypothetical protein